MPSTIEITRNHFETLTHPAWQDLFRKYYLRITEAWMGREGHGMNALLYRRSDKKKIASIRDDGNGGCLHIAYYNNGESSMKRSAEYDEFLACVEKLPRCEMFGTTMSVGDELAISTLAEMAEYAAISKKARGKNCYLAVTPDMEEGQVLQFKTPKTTTLEQAKAGILKHRPNAFVINELF